MSLDFGETRLGSAHWNESRSYWYPIESRIGSKSSLVSKSSCFPETLRDPDRAGFRKLWSLKNSVTRRSEIFKGLSFRYIRRSEFLVFEFSRHPTFWVFQGSEFSRHPTVWVFRGSEVWVFETPTKYIVNVREWSNKQIHEARSQHNEQHPH